MFPGTEGLRLVMQWSSGSMSGPGPGLGSAGCCPGLVALVLLPLLAVGLGRWSTPRTAPRLATWALLTCAALAAYWLTFRLGGLAGHGEALELVQPLGRVLAVQRLQLAVGLGLDAPAAAGLFGLALLAAWAVRQGGVAAWLGAAYAATAVALFGDGLVTRLVGWELMTVAGWGLGRRRAAWGLWLGRAGDATLLVATALLFWSLGGSWSAERSGSRYQLDASPLAIAAASRSAESAASPGPTLELTDLRRQLHAATPTSVPMAGAALANKLWLGGRLLTWLGVLFGLAALFKGVAGLLQLLGERQSVAAVRLWLFAAPLLAGWHLLWRLR